MVIWVGSLAMTLVWSALFGLLCGFACRNDREPLVTNVLMPFIGLLVGLFSAGLFHAGYPILFDHLLEAGTWTGWLPLRGPVFAYLPSCPWVILVGFALGCGISCWGNAAVGRFSWRPLPAFALGFLIVWGLSAEFLPPDVHSEVKVYQFSDPQHEDWDDQSEAWIRFLETTCSPGMTYYAGGPEGYRTFIGEEPRPKEIVFVFVKQYYRDGKPINKIGTYRVGFLNAEELRTITESIARSSSGSWD
ncbi:MAG: hypothetical protein K2W82_16955 [Candidatus Obscuribacterales bacterium]|nr:hypothetical protein [Candidatus Obscuribacterales bacterium]